MKYAFHPEAEAEFLDAIDYYEGCEPESSVSPFMAFDPCIAALFIWK